MRTKLSIDTILFLICLAGVAGAATVREWWGPEGIASPHPKTMRTVIKAKVPVIEIDLSALPKDAKVFHAALCNKRVGQPNEPIQILAVASFSAKGEPEYEGKPLALEPPLYASYDVSALVKTWQSDPAKNRGLALVRPEGFDPKLAYLEICYEGKAENPPPQISNLKAVHHDGQTFLTWKEMDMFQPAADKCLWVGNFGLNKEEFKEPGKGFKDMPRLPCIRQGELRRLQMYKIIPPPRGTQLAVRYERLPGWPDVSYRIYRSKNKITPENIKDAELLNDMEPLCAYDQGMVGIGCSGEYYDKHELPETAIPTYCLEDGKPIALGEAFYVSTTQEDGPYYYCVTLMKDGVENMVDISAGNSLQAPVEEKKAPFKPVLQYITDSGQALSYKHYCWPAPPACNLPSRHASGVTLSVPKGLKEPCGLSVIFGGPARSDWLVVTLGGHGGLAYSEGLGTFRSIAECKADYFDERYMLYSIQGIMSKWKIDPDRTEIITGTPFAIRHPELFKVMSSGAYEIGFEPRWNPSCGTLFSMFGPPEAAIVTVDGFKAWDILSLGWYLRTNPGKDIPFFFCQHGGKESGHAIEFGWQDDPMGWAALRDGRVPYAGSWGGGGISPEVRKVVAAMPRDRTLPAFSNCSLDSNPGNGDPADGDPWGQFNGYLVWDFDTSVDKADQWGMTVSLTSDAFRNTCTVDITPRRCSVFKPKPGAAFKWTNKSVADGKVVQSDKVVADQWGLVTVKQAIVTKGRNRIEITK